MLVLKLQKVEKNKMLLPTQRIFDLDLFAGTKEQALSCLEDVLFIKKKETQPYFVFTPNPEHVVIAQSDPLFLKTLQQGNLLLPDGIGMIWASKVLKRPLVSRVTGVDTVKSILELCSHSPERPHIFIVGGRDYHGRELLPGKLVISDVSKQPFAQVVWSVGYADVRAPLKSEEEQLLSKIKSHSPSLILVAFGAPWQEKWIVTHQKIFEEAGVKVIISVGGSVDYLTGKVKRAPVLVQRAGLEWLHRLIMQPWRWRRQLRLLSFVRLVLKKWLKK